MRDNKRAKGNDGRIRDVRIVDCEVAKCKKKSHQEASLCKVSSTAAALGVNSCCGIYWHCLSLFVVAAPGCTSDLYIFEEHLSSRQLPSQWWVSVGLPRLVMVPLVLLESPTPRSHNANFASGQCCMAAISYHTCTLVRDPKSKEHIAAIYFTGILGRTSKAMCSSMCFGKQAYCDCGYLG